MKKWDRKMVYGLTDVGLTRQNNEDCFAVDARRKVMIVSDGMGGHNAGEVASKETVEFLKKKLKEKKKGMGSQDYETLLKQIIIEAHEKIVKLAEEKLEYQGMGCTVVVGIVDEGKLHTCHVGDSRVYRINEQAITQLGVDHSVVAQSVEAGLMSPEEAWSSNLRNRLTMAIGAPQGIDPEYVVIEIQDNDRIILCSDGLWDMVPDEEIQATALKYNDASSICSELIEKANAAGGKDNITVVTYISNT